MTETAAPWRLTDEDRVLYSETIPGHLWDAVRRICECGAEIGLACDAETVEQHLDAAANPTPTTRRETEPETDQPKEGDR